jgi:hypothetical protein
LNLLLSKRRTKYAATVNGVREIRLVGSADHAYWANRLAAEKRVPTAIEGRAEIWLCAARLKWMGVRFVDLSISIRVGRDGADVFLIAAFTTSRLFAFCERTFFHTPYQHAAIDFDAASLRSFTLRVNGALALNAKRAPAQMNTTHEAWQGRIFLPSNVRKPCIGRYFYAELSGVSEVSQFDPTTDGCTLDAASHCAVVQQLIESGFRGVEWHVRTTATHARSKTYTDKQVLTFFAAE